MFMEKVMQAVKISLSKLYRYRFRMIASVLALVLAMSVFNYWTNNNASSATMSLNYAEASAGLNPNSTRFNMSEIVSQSVMSRVVKAAGLDGEIEWDELAKCVSTSSVDRGKSSSGYISTTYQISYNQSKLSTKPKHLPNPEDMIKLICTTYKSYFLDNYGDNKSILSYEPLVADNDEPYIAISSLEVKLNQIYRYINMRIKENKTYKDEETGLSFISLMKDVENMINYDIGNIYAFILETGVTKDQPTLIALETYKNLIEQLAYDNLMVKYDADTDGIVLYDEAMSAIVMIPSVTQSNEYYMSRTNNAADSMAKSADSELKEAMSYLKSITNTEYLISQISGYKSANARNLKTAATMILELKNNIDRISDELKLLDISYIKYKTQNYLVFSYSDRSFMDKISIKRTAIVAAAAIVGFYLVLFVISMKQLRKKKKIHAKV